MSFKFDRLDLIVVLVFALITTIYFQFNKITRFLFPSDSLTPVNSNSRDIVQVLKENNKDYLVLYASQTGTCEEYAKKFARELVQKFSLNVMCVDVDDYDFENLNMLPKNVIVSLFVSTYGEGDLPDSAMQFEEWLQTLSAFDLNNVYYTLFGFGNSTYEFFNGGAKKVEKYFSLASATRVGSFGLADDGSCSTDEDYLAWKDAIYDDLKDALALYEREIVFESSYNFSILPKGVDDKVSVGEPSSAYLPGKSLSYNSEKKQLGPFDASYPYIAPIIKTKELMRSAERNCIHVEFDISGSNMKYSTGDHVAVWPSNSDEKVEKFISTFGLDSNTVFDLKPKDKTMKIPFPVPTTIGAAVRYYLEISGPISRQVFSSISQYVNEPKLKEKLSVLSKDKTAFSKEITSKCFDFATAFSHLSNGAKWDQVPWEYLVETIPHIQPRYYSISSSASSEKQVVHITAVVENRPNQISPELGPVTGVTTNLLRHIHLSKSNEDVFSSTLPVHYNLDGPRGLLSPFKLPIHIVRSTFKLPANPSTPLIMVGPGTGVAPFRGFIRERVKNTAGSNNLNLGKHLLFYGCRNEEEFLYRDEWAEYSKSLNGVFEFIIAYSRIPGKPKTYVQNLMIERKAELFALIEKGAFIYVCGDAKNMSQDVHKIFVDILSEGKGITTEEASEILKLFKTSGKYQEDVW